MENKGSLRFPSQYSEIITNKNVNKRAIINTKLPVRFLQVIFFFYFDLFIPDFPTAVEHFAKIIYLLLVLLFFVDSMNLVF